MKFKIHFVARIVFGFAFLLFGINGFLKFMPVPPVSAEAATLLGAFAKTGYFFPMIKLVEIFVGAMLLLNLLAPLAVVVITPVLIGITTIHLFLNPTGLAMMIVLHILHLILVYGYCDYYKMLFVLKAAPSK